MININKFVARGRVIGPLKYKRINDKFTPGKAPAKATVLPKAEVPKAVPVAKAEVSPNTFPVAKAEVLPKAKTAHPKKLPATPIAKVGTLQI